MAKIVILGNTFPDANFIQEEAEYFTDFDQVIYCPKNIGTYLEPPISSSNFLVVKPVQLTTERNTKWSKIKTYLPRIFTKYFFIEFPRIVKKGHSNFTKRISICLNYIDIATQYKNSVIKVLDDMKVDKDEEIVFYGYRYHVHTLTALMLQKEYRNSITIARAHGYDLYEFRAPSDYLPFREYQLKKINRLFCISEHGMAYLLENHSRYNDKIELAYLGTTDNGLQEWEPSKVLRLVSCSRISKEKRIDFIIDSLAYLEGPWKWVHIGGGEDLQRLKQRVNSLFKGDKTVDFKGYLDHSRIIELYCNNPFDLFLSASDNEGLPVTMMESLSFGIPVLGTDVGGVSEIVNSSSNGYLVDKDIDPKEYAEQINRIRESSIDMTMGMRQNSRSVYMNKFDVAKNARDFSKQVYELMGDSNAKGR